MLKMRGEREKKENEMKENDDQVDSFAKNCI